MPTSDNRVSVSHCSTNENRCGDKEDAAEAAIEVLSRGESAGVGWGMRTLCTSHFSTVKPGSTALATGSGY